MPDHSSTRPSFNFGNAAFAVSAPNQASSPHEFAGSSALNELTTRSTSSNLEWGAPLEPRHFNWDEATMVRPRITGSADVFPAISIVGSGSFKANDAAPVQQFENGGVLVRGPRGVQLFTPENFVKRFVTSDGELITHLLQIDYQTPVK